MVKLYYNGIHGIKISLVHIYRVMGLSGYSSMVCQRSYVTIKS